MIDKLKKILISRKDISGWKIKFIDIESEELFFIRKSLDMNRCKNVEHLKLTIYMDCEDDGKKYRGSSTAEIHPTYTEDEIREAIDETAFAASLIKNDYYPLAKPCENDSEALVSNFSEKPLAQWVAPVTDAIFKADVYSKGYINSTEVFLSKIYTRILNSEGVDVNFTNYSGTVEFIVDWKEIGEEIELYKNIEFSEFDSESITQKVDEMLKLAKHKAFAGITPKLKKSTVLLTGEPVATLFSYYYYQANAEMAYNKLSNFNVGESVQGDSIEGDRINITLKKNLRGSTKSMPYDSDGFPISDVSLIEEGVLKRYWGNIRYSHYLGAKPTGNIENIVVGGGSKSIEELKEEPYLELLAFSDFQIDDLTGDFAGEIRFGWYYDGISTVPVTGGSISGNLKEVHNKLFISRELQQDNEFVGPKTVKLSDINVAGIK